MIFTGFKEEFLLISPWPIQMNCFPFGTLKKFLSRLFTSLGKAREGFLSNQLVPLKKNFYAIPSFVEKRLFRIGV